MSRAPGTAADRPGQHANDSGAAESRLARFFEVSNVAFWTADAAGRVTLTATSPGNPVEREHFIESVEEQAESIHPDDRAFAITTWLRALSDGKSYDIEVRRQPSGGGEFRWTRLRAFPDVIDGVVQGWFGTAEDIHERHLTGLALAESEARFRRLADDLPVMVWLTDIDARANYLSRAWYEFTGQTPAEAHGHGWLERVHPDDRRLLKLAHDANTGRASFEMDFRIRGADGDYRWVHGSGRSRCDDAGELIGHAGCLIDIHARKVAEGELAALQQRLSKALDGTGIGVWEWNAVTDEMSVSVSALGISGYRTRDTDFQRVDYRSLVHPDDLPRLLAGLEAHVAGKSDAFEIEMRIRSRGGGWVWVLDRGTATVRDTDGRGLQMVGTLTNIEASKRAEARLRWTVEHDALTGLGNRMLFQMRLDEALDEMAGGRVALALLDVDEFKSVNDVHGHFTGDALLIMLASRLRAFVHDGETVARLGGDEFVIILPGCGSDADVTARLTALRAQLMQPFEHDGQTLHCGASIGISIATRPDEDSATLLKHADIAMYAAKSAGEGGVALFDPSLAARVTRQIAARNAVRLALRDDRVELVYQPIVRLTDRTVVGIKTLIRLGDAAEPLDPGSLANQDGDTAVALGERINERAFADYASWSKSGRPVGFLGLHASVFELRRPGYAAQLLRRAATAGIAPAHIEICICESIMHEQSVAVVEASLATLHDAGASIVLDRFGTGFGGLALLKRLPLAALKIAPSFVAGVASDEGDAAVARAVVELGRAFDLRIIADGVADEKQAAALLGMSCGYALGPLFHGALSAADVARLV